MASAIKSCRAEEEVVGESGDGGSRITETRDMERMIWDDREDLPNAGADNDKGECGKRVELLLTCPSKPYSAHRSISESPAV